MAGTRFVLTLILVLTVLVALSLAEEDGIHTPSTEESGATCQEIRALLVHDSTDGVRVTMSSSIAQNTSFITIPGEHLPEECGRGHRRCNIVPISSDTHVFVLFSVERGIVIVDYNQTTMEYIGYFVFTTPVTCNPTAVFLTSETNIGYQLFTACISHFRGNSYFEYLEFRFGNTDITTASFRNVPISDREMIYDLDTLSEFVYARNQWDCLSANNVYVLDQGYVIAFLADVGHRQLNFPDPELCLEQLSVEYHGNDLLLVHCLNDTSLTFDSCRGFVTARYQLSESGLPYPCSDWDTVAVVKDGNLTFNTSENSEVDNTTTLTLPTGAIENAQCVGGNQDTIFVFTVNRKTTYAFSASDNLLLEIVPLSCNATECFKPIVLSTEGTSIVGAYDYKSSRFMVANPTCTSNPVILDLPVVQPNLAAVFFGRTRHSCQCKPVTEPPSTSPTTTETETEQTSPTTVPSTEMPTTTDEATSELTPTTPDIVIVPPVEGETFGTGALVAGAVAFLVVSVAVVMAALLIYWYRCRTAHRHQGSRTDSSTSLSSSVPSNPWNSVELGTPRESPERVHGGASNLTDEFELYGISPEGDVVTPEPARHHGEVDVTGVYRPTMPAEHFHTDYMLEEQQRRSKDNDFKMKMKAFQDAPGEADSN